MKRYYFDMDGTIADLYGREDWLERIQEERAVFHILAPMVDMLALQKVMSLLRTKGDEFGVITWLPKDASYNYTEDCAFDKAEWLEAHFGTDAFQEIHIVNYDTPKHEVPQRKLTRDDVLIDDNWDVLRDWYRAGGLSIHASQILNYLVKQL